MGGREQLVLDLGHRQPSLAAEDFLAAPGNREALAWVVRWPDWPGPALVLHGPEGSGKSHLARILAARTGAHWLDPAEPGEPEPGPGEVWIADPAPPVRDEARLLRIYNRVHEQRGHLLLTARAPVAGWGLVLPDLASRLRAAPAAAIAPPDDALLAALLVKQFADRQLTVGDEVIPYLVTRIERSFAAAQRVVAALDALALRERRRITVSLARRLLEHATRSTD